MAGCAGAPAGWHSIKKGEDSMRKLAIMLLAGLRKRGNRVGG